MDRNRTYKKYKINYTLAAGSTKEEAEEKYTKQAETTEAEETPEFKAALASVQKDGFKLRDVIPEYKQDKRIVMAAIKQNVGAIIHAHEDLQRDTEIMLEVKKLDDLEYQARRNIDSKEVVMAEVQRDGTTLQYHKQYNKDEDIVMAAVKQNVEALEYANVSLRGDRDFALKVVQQNGLALLYLIGMQNDEDVVLAAVKQNGLALEYVLPRYKTDKVVKAALAQNSDARQYM